MDYPQTARKIADLPSDGGKVVDVVAGALLRIFVRLGEIDAALGRQDRRLAALEPGAPMTRPGPQPPKPAPGREQGDAPGPGRDDARPAPARDRVDAPADPAAQRGRGRPPGSKNRPKPNGFDHDEDRGGLAG